MNVEPLALPGVYRATPRRKAVRSYDWYRTDALAPALPHAWRPAIGTMHTVHRGELSGLHLEAGHRVITCVTGRLALVVVDARKGTSTYARWVPVDLEPIDRPTVVIPPGTAWGYQGFSDVSVVLMLHEGNTGELVIDPLDEELQITWPLPVEHQGLPLRVVVARDELLD